MKRPAYGHMIQRDYGSLRPTFSSQRTPREAHLWLHRTQGQTVRRVETGKDGIFRGYPHRRYLPCHRSREEGLVPTVRSSCDGRRHRDQEQFVRLRLDDEFLSDLRLSPLPHASTSTHAAHSLSERQKSVTGINNAGKHYEA